MLNPNLMPDVDRLLDEALALPPHARPDFISSVSRGRPDIAGELERVLAEDGRDDGFLTPGGALSPEDAREILGADAPAESFRLANGARIGDYEIVGIIGRGGMGEVYRAQDRRLGRDVALKLLPDHLARDPDRVRRFRSEARALAALSHPNVGAIFGVAEQDGIEALVLELVEGETLNERIARGPLPVAETIHVGRQIAEALQAAHARGIVHRDLKPGNVKMTPGGRVRVLDFGLARSIAGTQGSTLQYEAITAPHAVLGTAPYISPEHARGRPVDARADIWAFGCLLFEMLTGRRAFDGDSPTEILAHALTREPDLARLPPDTPRPLAQLIEKCLAKDPAARLPDIGQALISLQEAALPAAAPGRSAGPRAGLRLAGGRALAGIVMLAAAIGAAYLLLARDHGPVHRLAVPIPAGDELVVSSYPLVAISPDGERVVYRARRGGVIQLLQRTLERLEPEVVPGTANAAAPFFSPDGRWLAFDGDGSLMKVSVDGGEPVRICEAPGGVVGSWGDDGTIVFATATGRVLRRIRPGRSTPETLTALDAGSGDISHGFPEMLPGSRAAVFTVVRPGADHVAAVRLDNGDVRILTEGAQARFLSTGHLVFARGSTLWAAPFDVQGLRLRSEPRPVLEDVDASENGVAHFAVSENGTLVYVPPRAAGADRELTWFDATGGATVVPGGPRRFVRAAASPEGSRIAAAIREGQNTDIWIFDEERQSASRLTGGPEEDTAPLWTLDGREVVFRSARQGGGLFIQDASGSTPARQLTRASGDFHTPYGWTPDGRTLLVSVFRGYHLQSIASLDMDGSGGLRVLLSGEFAQLRPAVSPDGRWLAYQSDESGRFEVYVRPYPDVDAGRWQVSTNGGTSPEWSPDGRHLYYHDGEWMISAAISPGPAFSAGAPVQLFEVHPFSSRLGPDYDLAAGPRFLMIVDRPPADPVARRPQLVLVQNWFTELRERLQ